MKLGKILNITIVTACITIAGCNNNSSVKSSSEFEETAFTATAGLEQSSSENTLTLNIALNETYCLKTACSCIADLAAREYDTLQKILLDKYNIDLKITYFVEEFHLKDTLKSKQYDGTICKPWLAIQLIPETGIPFKRVADLLDPDNNQWLKGIFIVKKESAVTKLEEINNLILVCGQPDSYEKYHSPLAILESNRIVPSQFIYKSGCTECINALLDNQAEVAVISDYALTASCAVDIAPPEDFRTIHETEQMPLCSVILDMSKVSEADALRLQKALLEISGDNAPASLLSRGFVLPASWKPVPYIKSEVK
jgi:ABC-type phosphate/phosphonate transport system substrate-binding protein